MPILQSPCKVAPGFCGGISMLVSPVIGNFFRYLMLGITSADEQSNVPAVDIFSTVRILAFAVVLLGEYPPFARMSMICVPSTMATLAGFVESSGGWFDRAIKIAITRSESVAKKETTNTNDVFCFIEIIC